MSSAAIKEIGSGSFWGLVSTIAIKILALFYLLFQARFFDPAEIGLFQLVFSIVALITLFTDAGISDAIVRYVAYYLGKGKPELAKGVYKYSLFLFALLSFGIAVIFFLMIPIITEFYNNPALLPILYIAAVYVLLTFFNKGFAFIVALKKVKLNAKLNIFQQFLKVFLTVVFAFWLGATAEALMLAVLFGLGISWIIGFFYSLKSYQKIPKKPKYSWSLFKSQVLPFSIVVAATSSMVVLISVMDKIMLGSLLVGQFSAKEVASLIGHYSVCFGFAGSLLLFTTAISSIFLPVLSGLHGKNKLSEIRQTSHRVIYWLVLLSTPIFMVFLAFPSQILTILSPNYIQDRLIFMILSVGFFSVLFGWVQAVQFVALRKNKINLLVGCLGAILNIILNLLLIPQYNILGAAISYMITFIFITLCFIYFGYRELNFELPVNLFKPLLAGALVVLILFVFKPLLGEILRIGIPQIINNSTTLSLILEKTIKVGFLALVAGLSFIVYLVVLVLLKGFSKEDVGLLAAAMKKGKIPKKIINFGEKMLSWQVK